MKPRRSALAIAVGAVLTVAALLCACSVRSPVEAPSTAAPGVQSSGVPTQALELVTVLRSKGAVVEPVRVSEVVSGTAFAPQATLHVAAISALDERDVYVLLASILERTPAPKATVGVLAPRNDGTEDIRVYEWTGEQVRVFTGRRSHPGGMGGSGLRASVADVDAARIRGIAMGELDVPTAIPVGSGGK